MLLQSAAGVLVIQVYVLCAGVSANPGGGEVTAGEWAQWSSWSSCSVDCGTGISIRTRTCQHPFHRLVASIRSSTADSVQCSGNEKEIKLCNRQACTNGKKSLREDACQKYDKEVHTGQRYTWEPFIHPTDPCKLSCRVKGHHFYSNLAERVVDGTPCHDDDSNTPAVCIQGVCEEVGCDDIVGSPWRRDECGVCKGDSSSCRKVSGIFMRQDLQQGFNDIITIPSGSTQINITGLRYSINFLALQYPGGSFILNGGVRRDRDGDYKAAGAVFSYHTSRDCYGQCVYARGPTDQDIDLILNTRGSNRGIKYSFNVPINVTDEYYRRIIGTTESSETSAEDEPPSRNENDSPTLEQNSDDGSVNDDDDEDDQISVVNDNEDEKDGEDSADGYDETSEEHREEEEGVPLVDSLFEDNDSSVSAGSEAESTDKEYWPHEGDEEEIGDDVDGDGIDGEEEPWSQNDDDDDDDYDDVGAPEPIQQLMDQPRKIMRKKKPRFIDPYYNSHGSLGSSGRNSEFLASSQTDSADQDNDDFDEDEFEDEDGELAENEENVEISQTTSTEPMLTTTTASAIDFEQLQTTRATSQIPEEVDDEMEEEEEEIEEEDEEEDEKVEDGSKDEVDSGSQDSFSSDQTQTKSKDTPTSKPGGSVSLQSDSPATRTRSSYRTQPRTSQYSRRRFRRPQYSQSFTFRRGHRLTVQAGRRVPAGNERKSGHREQRPKTSTYVGNIQVPGSTSSSSSGRQIRHRQRPWVHSSQRHGAGTSSFSGFEGGRPNPNPHVTSPRVTTYSRSSSGGGNSNGRRTPTTSRRRQALTLGRTVSRDQDGTVRVTNGGNVSPGGAGSRIFNGRGQYSRQQSNSDWIQRQKQQQEYARQQEYRRELLRRRQEFEQQRAAQEAEYQRRLEEHNRRLRQREREMQERQRQRHSSSQHHDRRHHHGRQRQSQRERHRQPGTVPPTTGTISAPSGGIISRNDNAGRTRPSSSGTSTEQRPTWSPWNPSSRQHGGSRYAPVSRDRRPQQPVIIPNRRQPVVITPSPVVTTTTVVTTKETEAPVEEPVQELPATTTSPSTRDFLTNPAATPPVNPTVPAIIPNSAPQFIPDDSNYNSRSSLTAAASANQLPTNGDTPLVIGSQGNVVPNVVETETLGGGDGIVLTNEGGEQISYEWRVSGLTECTLTCGGGMQQTVVVCLDTRTQAVVTDGNCQHVERPKSKGVTCNTRPCPARWQATQWSPCSVTCGPGEQSRSVACLARISATLNLTMPDDNCLSQGPRPDENRACPDNLPCNTWKVGNWSDCSVRCGNGIRTRQVYCVDQTQFDVSDDLCPGSKPDQEEPCEMGPCGKGWYYTEWPTQCPAQCGAGTMVRKATCLAEGGSPLPDTSCDMDSRPSLEQTCKANSPCGGEWFTGEWQKCNATCGGGYQEREVVCMKSLPGGLITVVDEENCVASEKPDDLNPCESDVCAVEWYMTSWTECSQSCGTGHRTREVRCLDSQQRPSSDCPPDKKPRTRNACNTASCTTRPPTPPSASDCQDSFTRCEIVKHARMCRFRYYQEKCCATCADET